MVSPASASVITNATQSFSAVVNDQYGQPLSPQPSIAWSVSGGGSINSSGLFTAGSTAGGPHTVTATSGALTGTAAVTVALTPPVATSIVVSPANPSVAASTTRQFTAVMNDQHGQPLASQPSFTWSVTGGGTIDSSGLFTAGGV